jgi:hypothetical protein
MVAENAEGQSAEKPKQPDAVNTRARLNALFR